MSSLLRKIIIIGICSFFFVYFFLRKPSMMHALSDIKTSKDAIALIPTSVSQIESRTAQSLEQAKQALQKILDIPDDQRTYANTAAALDQLNAFSNAAINASAIATLELVHPDEAVRNAARAAVLEAQNWFIDHIATNRQLYKAFKAYVDGNAHKEDLSDEQQRFLQETMKEFTRAGLDKSDEELAAIQKIKKELVQLEQDFDKNIAHDQSKITVDVDGLTGLSDDFIKNLLKAEDGKYIIGIDYPTYMQVMENCTNGVTRKNLWHAYMNRAYPANAQLLQKIVAKRAELAQILGFKSFAAFELDTEMVQSPERAEHFLNDINQKGQKKAAQEFIKFTATMPSSVALTVDGKLNPWDWLFVKNQYKKSALSLDENKIAEYFPMQHTIDSLLKIYEQFFNLSFKQLPVSGLWDADVKMIEVIDNATGKTIGYLFLDLYPRPNKYNHACEHTMVPATYDEQGNPNLGVVIVVANFPKPTIDKPSLLQLKNVTTFFHEFGHAMHALLGRTHMASFAGASVKRDFVEMPSQMLEEWLWDPEILKMVSHHYQTGESLSDELIATILPTRMYDSGFFITRQMCLAKLALECFNDGSSVDLDALYKKIFNQTMYRTEYIPADHFYAAFGHLTGYGARYYGYMWSKVFAHDLFHAIKKEGLLNPEVGRRYVNAVIGKGGSKDPNDLLKDFLGREPNQDAFLHDMGLL